MDINIGWLEIFLFLLVGILLEVHRYSILILFYLNKEVNYTFQMIFSYEDQSLVGKVHIKMIQCLWKFDLYSKNKHLITRSYNIHSTASDHRYIPFLSIGLVFTSAYIQMGYFIPIKASFMLHQEKC